MEMATTPALGSQPEAEEGYRPEHLPRPQGDEEGKKAGLVPALPLDTIAASSSPSSNNTKAKKGPYHTPPTSPLPPTPSSPTSTSSSPPAPPSSSSTKKKNENERENESEGESEKGGGKRRGASIGEQAVAEAVAAMTTVAFTAATPSLEAAKSRENSPRNANKKLRKKKKKQKAKEKAKQKEEKAKLSKEEREMLADDVGSPSLRTTIKRALVDGYDKITETVSAVTNSSPPPSSDGASHRGHTSRLRTYSERSGTMVGPAVGLDGRRTGEFGVTSPRNEGEGSGRDRAATISNDLRTGSLVLQTSPRRAPMADLALSPRSQSGRDLSAKSNSAVSAPRHMSVSHKKPARIPGEKGSKVLRLQCPEGLECTSTDPDHFLKFQHTPGQQRPSQLRKREPEQSSETEVEKGSMVSSPVLIGSASSSPTSSSSPLSSPSSSPSFLEKKVFFEKLGMKSRSMRNWRGKEKKKDKSNKPEKLDDQGLTQRRICPLGDECTSTDPHHFLTYQHTIFNLEEKVKWINHTNTQSPALHVSGVRPEDIVDEEIEILSHAKRRGTESDMEDENEQESEKPVHPTETKDDPPVQEEQNPEGEKNVAKPIEVIVEEKTGEVDEDAHKNSTSSSHDTNQVTETEMTESKQNEEQEPSATNVPKLAFLPPPVPPKPTLVSPRRVNLAPPDSGASEGETEPKDLKRLVKAASRHILSREFRTSQLRIDKHSAVRRKVESEKRESVVREIVTTERNYIRILQAILDLYQGPLEAQARAKKKWITEDQVKAIFYQIKVIHGLNSSLLKELEERTDERSWNESSVIGDIFVRMSSFLRVYASYNANYAKALLTLKQCKLNKKFTEFLESVTKSNEKKKQFVGSDLQSFLITPVQRIPRYIILLKMLRNHTMDDHPDFALINEALEKIEAVATENEKIHETSIQLLYLFQVQKKFVQANELGLVESHRRLVAESEVILHKFKVENGVPSTNVDSPHKEHSRKIFIFNDIIIVSKEANGKRDHRKESKKKREKERSERTAATAAVAAVGVAASGSIDTSLHDHEEGKWLFMYQLDVGTCEAEGLEDVFDFISSKYTQRNAIRLTDTASGRYLRLTLSSPEEKQRLLDQLQDVIASFVRNLSSSTASGATKSPAQTNQRSSSYIIPSSTGSGATGLIHKPSGCSTGTPTPSPPPSSSSLPSSPLDQASA